MAKKVQITKRELKSFDRIAHKILTNPEDNTTVRGMAVACIEGKDGQVQVLGMITNLSKRDVLRLVCDVLKMTALEASLELVADKDLDALVKNIKKDMKKKTAKKTVKKVTKKAVKKAVKK